MTTPQVSVAVLVSCTTVLACGPTPPSLELVRADGAVARAFDGVERATTPEARAQGLVGHAGLGPSDAMVLEYPVVDTACITNAHVTFPIVAVYVAQDGTIVATEPLAAHATSTPCHDAVRWVVEIDEGGTRGATRVVFRP